MKELILSMLLFFVAVILFLMLLPLAIVVGVVSFFFKRKLNTGLASLADWFYSWALAIDQLGNVVCGPLFNLIFITDSIHEFGDPDETISSVLGKNKLANKLTWLGDLLERLLHLLDKDHSVKSIEY